MSDLSFKKDGTEFEYRTDPGAVLRAVLQQRHLFTQLVRRDIVGRYRGSLFGIVWAFLNPLLMLSLYTIVFGMFLRTRWAGSQNSFEFSVVLFAGLILFNFFAECINRAPMLVVANANYVKKVVFPLEMLAWVAVGTAFFHTVISLIVWVIFSTLVYGTVHWTLVYLPLILVPLIFMTIGLVWIVSSLGVYLRDIGQVIGVATSVVMFLSPIFYPVDTLPESFRALLLMNPLTFLIEQARLVMLGGGTPDISTLAIYMASSIAFAWLALAWFQHARKGFADVL
ncbi:polysaccharide ABC efflux pump, inner membrane subunit [Cupriavidus sp. HMR-1]|uniref:ABC transporter permease n=1 Tax=Cupriavidus sp. HMR-1 TaxID=1249621 RepID=UPI0002A39475|nr:ABC transporter permease [Cupriavidus sp. HMR-1]EKZ95731.1 polysaccharide ABC efflux pump, inner membrane subunit [Cupriavidus sp. HMR-1]